MPSAGNGAGLYGNVNNGPSQQCSQNLAQARMFEKGGQRATAGRMFSNLVQH